MRRPVLAAFLAAGSLALPAGTAHAGALLDRVRAEGTLHCGAAIRPGLAFPAPDGQWHGLEVDICRAAATAVLGPQARTEFHAYSLQASSYGPVKRGEDELSFLTLSEMLYGGVLGSVLPGPPVYYATSGVMVMDGSPARHLADLAGTRICAEPGTGPERSLNDYFAARRWALNFSMFQESDEMLDAFYGERCESIANETTSLAAIRLQAEQDGHAARILPEPLAAVPIMAATPRGDDAWSAIVGWTVQTLVRGETLAAGGPGGGTVPLPLADPALGLPKGWAGRGAGRGRRLRPDLRRGRWGSDSPLDLPRGLNALWTQGGLMCPPFAE